MLVGKMGGMRSIASFVLLGVTSHDVGATFAYWGQLTSAQHEWERHLATIVRRLVRLSSAPVRPLDSRVTRQEALAILSGPLEWESPFVKGPSPWLFKRVLPTS